MGQHARAVGGALRGGGDGGGGNSGRGGGRGGGVGCRERRRGVGGIDGDSLRREKAFCLCDEATYDATRSYDSTAARGLPTVVRAPLLLLR